MSQRAVEFYYTVPATALLLGFCTKTVIEKLKAGEFGRDVVDLGTAKKPDYRVPASGINAYLAARRFFSEPLETTEFIAARTPGELRRKA